MFSDRVGQITHYDGELRVAGLALTNVLREHDWLHIVGLTTDLVQPVQSLELHHQRVTEAGPGQEIILPVHDRVHIYDAVFRITAAEAQAANPSERSGWLEPA